MFKGIKGLLAVLAIATGAWAEGNVWDGSVDTDWYGDGSETEFTITTAEQLAGLAELVNGGNNMSGKTITLGNDIMLNNTTDWQDWDETTAPANTWTAIGMSTTANLFTGTFDGAGHVVSGVYINRTETATADNFQGLFGYVGNGGTIKNLGVVSSYVKGNQYVGGLAGCNIGGTITNSYATGNVTGTYNVGGLVGQNSGTITNSYATGNVSGTGSNVGGLVGQNSNSCTITNSYATGNVSGTSDVGGLVGRNWGTITSSYYDRQTSGQNDTKGIGLTTNEMKSQAFADKLNFGVIANNNSNLIEWVYTAGNYPVFGNTRPSGTFADYFASGDGTQDNPYIIQTPEQLEYLSTFTNAGKTFEGEYIKLGNNIMLNDTTDWQNWETTAPANTWTAIGYSSQFLGTFDGAGYVVGGVYINNTNNSQGLFGYVGSGGMIENLGVVASYVKGGMYIGGLVGGNWGSIANSYATGNVTGTYYVGGLAGSNYGTISNSYDTGNVDGEYGVGGLAGVNNGGTITNSYATGNVSGTSEVGGLVGLNYSSPITNSYYDSETSGQSDDDGRGEPKTTAEMKKQETYADWDFDDIWGIDENNGYPYLWEFFIDIGNISGAITSAVYNETKSLSATVEPNNATIKTIAWSVTNGNATISGNNITFTKAGQLTIKATITNGLGNGSDYTQNFNINVAKAAGTFVATTALNATYTPTLTLANITLPANYAWSAPTTSLSAGSNQTFAATYTDPSGNYNPATGNITVNIAKANGTGTVAITGWTYGQAANAPTISGQTAEYGVPSYTYSAQGANDYTATVPTAVGSYTVKATFAATANYNEHTATADFAIAKANGTGTVEIAGWTHGQAANAPTISGQTAEYGEPSYTYSAKDANDYTATVPTNAGSYTVKATFAETANYNEHTATADFAIAAIPTYAVTVTNGTGSGNYEAGATVTLTANAPEAGMEFKNWDITPAVTFTAGSAATPEAEFTMPAEAVTATAVYEAIPINNHLITVTIEGNGIANANVVSAPQGTQITLTATPNSGNRFVRWNVVSGGITLSNATTATATFTIPNNAVAVKAVFEVIPTPILPSQIATGNKAVQTSNGINLTATTNATVEIFNLKGSLISRQNFASGVHAIQLGHLPKGMYIVKVSFGSSKQVLRMPIK